MSRIGIFGGTFNPIHNGHILAAEEFLQQMELDRVILIPAATPPHKQLPTGTPDAETRLEMVRAAVSELPWAQVSDLELQREGKSYTADTIRLLREQFPTDELFLLMGTDSYLALDHWYHPEEILRMATVVCAHRSKENEETCTELEKQKQFLLDKYGAQSVILENRMLEISSSTVRRMMLLRCGQMYVSKAVYEIVEERGLYGVKDELRGLPFTRLTEKSLSLTRQKRAAHVLGCCQTAVELAEKYGANAEDAARAGILHDVTKALDGPEQLILCGEYDIILDNFERKNDKLLHAKTGAAVAGRLFGENEAVCSAIYWHTTGKADMTLLEKILYLADYIEPNRDFPGVAQLRALAYTDLDAALLDGFEMSLELLEKRGKPIDPNSLAARDYILNCK